MTVAEARLEPGWLMRVVHQAHIACMADHNPIFYGRSPPKFEAGDEHEIYERMDVRFRKWTGQALSDYVREHR